MKTYHRVLTIAGSDPSGGAGIQADIKTISACGCFAASAITAVVDENTLGVTGVHSVPLDFVRGQICSVLDDIGADAIKIGMLDSPALVEVVAEMLEAYRVRHVVLDPVMVAQSGDRLVSDSTLDVLRGRLLPLATVLTPNQPEAEVLLGRKISSPAEVAAAALDLQKLGCPNVLLKGGHFEADAVATDWLAMQGHPEPRAFSVERIQTRNNHGTGCTLSSAIASFLAKGEPLDVAVRHAKTYITEAIRAGAEYQIGRGNGPVHHFWAIWS